MVKCSLNNNGMCKAYNDKCSKYNCMCARTLLKREFDYIATRIQDLELCNDNDIKVMNDILEVIGDYDIDEKV